MSKSQVEMWEEAFVSLVAEYGMTLSDAEQVMREVDGASREPFTEREMQAATILGAAMKAEMISPEALLALVAGTLR